MSVQHKEKKIIKPQKRYVYSAIKIKKCLEKNMNKINNFSSTKGCTL